MGAIAILWSEEMADARFAAAGNGYWSGRCRVVLVPLVAVLK